MASELKILTEHFPGYGSSPSWSILVIYKNKLLERVDNIHSERALGGREHQLSEKWNAVADLDGAAETAPLASPWCSVCGKDTLSGRIHCCDSVFCYSCRDAGEVDKAKTAYEQRADEFRKRREAAEVERRAAATAEIRAALAGAFHWRDNWYFKRGFDGQVRIMVPAEMPMSHEEYLKIDLTIPPNEWASIACAVSAEGETGERWNAAQDFHGRPSSPLSRPQSKTNSPQERADVTSSEKRESSATPKLPAKSE